MVRSFVYNEAKQMTIIGFVLNCSWSFSLTWSNRNHSDYYQVFCRYYDDFHMPNSLHTKYLYSVFLINNTPIIFPHALVKQHTQLSKHPQYPVYKRIAHDTLVQIGRAQRAHLRVELNIGRQNGYMLRALTTFTLATNLVNIRTHNVLTWAEGTMTSTLDNTVGGYGRKLNLWAFSRTLSCRLGCLIMIVLIHDQNGTEWPLSRLLQLNR